jgi:hypothetical protein
MATKKCPCGSEKTYSNCCEKFFNLTTNNNNLNETILLEWTKKYAPPIKTEFQLKMHKYLFRLSYYLDVITEKYLYLHFNIETKDSKEIDEMLFYMKHNPLSSIFAGLACLEQGLFMQSGAIFRSSIESCMVLIDVCEHEEQMQKLLQDKYSINNIISRIKTLIPNLMIKWYGYFTKNFAHFGPLHSAPYLPRKCWPDNWMIVIGIQNIVWACFAFGIALERIHFKDVKHHLFWKKDLETDKLIFSEEGPIWDWNDNMRKEIITQFPPNERKEGCTYTEKSYKLDF